MFGCISFHLLFRVQLVEHLRLSYRSKSEFYDVFKQDKCPRLDFKRIFICLRSFDALKTRIKCLVSITFHRIVDGRFVMKTIQFKQKMTFQSFKIIQEFKKVSMRRFFLFCLVYILMRMF